MHNLPFSSTLELWEVLTWPSKGIWPAPHRCSLLGLPFLLCRCYFECASIVWLTGDFFGIIKKYYKKINYIDNKHVIIVHNNEYTNYTLINLRNLCLFLFFKKIVWRTTQQPVIWKWRSHVEEHEILLCVILTFSHHSPKNGLNFWIS